MRMRIMKSRGMLCSINLVHRAKGIGIQEGNEFVETSGAVLWPPRYAVSVDIPTIALLLKVCSFVFAQSR
jgi:hypothetical protein